MKTQQILINFLFLLLLGFSCFLTVQIYQQSRINQTFKIDYAELNNVKYGLLNAHEWKRKVSNIIALKIEEFDITEGNRGAIRQHIQRAMYRLIDEVEIFLNQEKKQGNWFSRGLKSVAYGVAFDPQKFKQQVPAWTEEILVDLDNPATRQQLKDFLQQKMTELMEEKMGKENLTAIHSIRQRYSCKGNADCRATLNKKITANADQIFDASLLIIACACLLFLLTTYVQKQGNFAFFSLLAFCLVLLFGGLTTPMIDIDARIQELSFLLMGEEVAFREQVLFFQSKSITDVVEILLRHGDFQTILVGVLIALFSILFPLLKLLSTGFALSKPTSIERNKFIRFMVLKSGKWSMADVFVVAIFMAYIGFKGIIDSQLNQMTGDHITVDLITTHEGTALQVGFLLFTGYCLLSLAMSALLEDRLK